MSPHIRAAVAGDQAAIAALVRSQRLNPNGLDWQNFVVAADDDDIVAAAQIRHHRDGSHELSSLVVAPDWRGAGLAARLIEVLLSAHQGPLCMVTGRTWAPYYHRWGFARVSAWRAPHRVRRNCVLGQLVGGAHAMLTGRPINRLVILMREGEGGR